MNKRTLMSIVLLAIVGTSAVFAQQPTLDKLAFATNGAGYTAIQKDRNISGAVVIPDTYNGKPVIALATLGNAPGITSVTIPNSVTKINTNAFLNDTGIKSITIPASVATIEAGAFGNCTNLTSVTFNGSNINLATGTQRSFDGDLDAKFRAGGAGTYTRQAGSNTWTKQGGLTYNGTGTRSDGAQVTITGDGQTITITGTAPGGGRFTETYKKQ